MAKLPLPANACKMAGGEKGLKKELWKPKVDDQYKKKSSTERRQICILGAARDLEVIGFSIFARLEDDSKALGDVADGLEDALEAQGGVA